MGDPTAKRRALIKLAYTNRKLNLSNTIADYRGAIAESSSNTSSCAGDDCLVRTA